MTTFPRRAISLVELLVVLGIIGALLALLMPAVQKTRRTAARISCQNNVHQLSLAVLNYESAHGRLPGNASADLHDWALAVLPYIEQEALAREFDPRYTAGEPANAGPARHRPSLFRCPNRTEEASFLPGVPVGHYGMNTHLAGKAVVTIPETTRTLLFGEIAADIPMPWVVSPPMVAPDAGFFHDGRTTVGFADGHVECLERGALRSIVFEIGKPTALVSEDSP